MKIWKNYKSLILVILGLSVVGLGIGFIAYHKRDRRPSIENVVDQRKQMLINVSKRPERALFLDQDWEKIKEPFSSEAKTTDRLSFLKAIQPLIDTKVILTDDSQKNKFRGILLETLKQSKSDDKDEVRIRIFLRRTLVSLGLPTEPDQLEVIQSWLSSKDPLRIEIAYQVLAKGRPVSEAWLNFTHRRIDNASIESLPSTLNAVNSMIDFKERVLLVKRFEHQLKKMKKDVKARVAIFLTEHLEDLDDPSDFVSFSLAQTGLYWDEVVTRLCRTQFRQWYTIEDLKKRISKFESETLRLRANELIKIHPKVSKQVSQ